MFAKPLFLFLAVAALSFSATTLVNVVSPPVGEVGNGAIVDAGTIGPGQTLPILINSIVTTGGIYGNGGTMDLAMASDLPSGWTTQESQLYQHPLQVTVTADPDAAPGNYTFNVTVINENNGEQLGNVTFTAVVQVTWDVMNFSVVPDQITVGPGQPAQFSLNITNKGSASDVFEVSATGAGNWDFTKQVFVPAMSTSTVPYEIVGDEGVYTPTLKVVSLASSNIAAEQNVTINVHPDLFGDYKAANHGTLLFPIFEAPIYAVAGLISNFLG
jgi:hypothetical protein